MKDPYSNEKVDVWLLKDNENMQYECIDKEIIPMISIVTQNHLLCYLIDVNKFEHLAEMKKIITEFAEKIDIINMNNIPLQKTINLMKNENNLQDKVVNFIKNADLYMDNFKYVDMDELNLIVEEGKEQPDEKVLAIKNEIIYSNFAHRFCLCTLKIQYLAVIQLSKVCCYAA